MKAIIFDFDGVIHDTFELAYGINIEVLENKISRDEYRRFFDGNIYDRVEISKESQKKFFIKQNKAFEPLKLEEDIKKVLKKISKEYSLFIVSSNQESALDTYFHNSNFIDIFKEIYGMETHKSKIEKFKMIFKKYNLESEDCIFITDTLGDILEANEVGLKTVAVDFGFHCEKTLKEGNPIEIVSSFDELSEVINKYD